MFETSFSSRTDNLVTLPRVWSEARELEVKPADRIFEKFNARAAPVSGVKRVDLFR